MTESRTVAVLLGGISPEREVSLASGEMAAIGLREQGFRVFEVEIATDGRWQQRGRPVAATAVSHTMVEALDPWPDIVFIALHGAKGEDGTIQGFLEVLGLPYTGSGVLASSLGMDKWRSRVLFQQEGLRIPPTVRIDAGAELGIQADRAVEELGWPLVVKPNDCGSSIGVRICRDLTTLLDGVDKAAALSSLVLLESYLPGVELTVPILGNEQARALPVIEVIPPGEFFDYSCKYDGSTQEICPARIKTTLAGEAQEIALRAYHLLGSSGFGRVDLIFSGGHLYLLEVNTIPGLTKESLVPKAARAAGIEFPQLMAEIVRLGLERSAQ
ncbi:MAG: D-alanine--D-alanine ligase [Coprothermobacterota bacterium]|nr:D-alanine--D-alanine ligase [Coprothermobacterota bacterium]